MGIVIKLQSTPQKNWRIGCYSLVYLDLAAKRAVKIFRKNVRAANPEIYSPPAFVYKDEVLAYEKIWGADNSSGSLDILRTLTPRFYGVCDIDKIEFDDVVDAGAGEYSLSQNYSMDLLDGNAIKLGRRVPVGPFYRYDLMPFDHKNAFYDQGIYHIYDCSYFDVGARRKYIDFRAGNKEEEDHLLIDPVGFFGS